MGVTREIPAQHESRHISQRPTAASSPSHALQRLGNHGAQVLLQKRVAQVQRQARNGLDTDAQAIVDAAKDSHAEPSEEKRAIGAVRSILHTYYPNDLEKVKDVVYSASEPGLKTTSQGRGASAQGVITVGSYFLAHIEQFARRVLQVGHELEHVQQYRTGLTGQNNSHKREFLAFYWEALQDEKTGTGRLSFATRRDLIDTALRHYYALSVEEQQDFAGKKDELLEKRAHVDGKHGNASTPAPTRADS
jgi:hypothetical protein